MVHGKSLTTAVFSGTSAGPPTVGLKSSTHLEGQAAVVPRCEGYDGGHLKLRRRLRLQAVRRHGVRCHLRLGRELTSAAAVSAANEFKDVPEAHWQIAARGNTAYTTFCRKPAISSMVWTEKSSEYVLTANKGHVKEA